MRCIVSTVVLLVFTSCAEREDVATTSVDEGLRVDVSVMTPATSATLTARHAVPGAMVSFWAGVDEGNSSCPPVEDPSCLGIRSGVWLGEAQAGRDGRATLSFVVPPTAASDVLLQATQTLSVGTFASAVIAQSVYVPGEG